MQGALRICPNCGKQTALIDPKCSTCGHKYGNPVSNSCGVATAPPVQSSIAPPVSNHSPSPRHVNRSTSLQIILGAGLFTVVILIGLLSYFSGRKQMDAEVHKYTDLLRIGMSQQEVSEAIGSPPVQNTNVDKNGRSVSPDGTDLWTYPPMDIDDPDWVENNPQIMLFFDVNDRLEYVYGQTQDGRVIVELGTLPPIHKE